MRFAFRAPTLPSPLIQFVLQEELMFEDLSNPLKGKGKEKDVGKRRAYVRVVTNLGGSSLNLELFCEKVGKPSLIRTFLISSRPRKLVTIS
jgi:peptidyl-prolyl cis-trans isomerase-like protein 2